MVNELKVFANQKKVFFGIKQCLKKSKEIDSVLLSSDHRPEVKKLLEANKIKTEVSEFDKKEISNKIGLDFHCEVFGIKK